MNNNKFRLTKCFPIVYFLIPQKGWNGEFFFNDKENGLLKQARFVSIHYSISTYNIINKKLTFETAEEDGTILVRHINSSSFEEILSYFYPSMEDYKKGQACSPQNVYFQTIPIEELVKIVTPFKCEVRYTYTDAVSIYRYGLIDGNKVEKFYFYLPTEYIYAPNLGIAACEEIVCPSNTFATEEECRDSIKVGVCRFGEKIKEEKPITFHIVAINGFAKEVNEDTYNKVKDILNIQETD